MNESQPLKWPDDCQRLIEDVWRYAFRRAHKKLGNREKAEDIAQIVSGEIWKATETGDFPDMPRLWSFVSTVTWRAIRDYKLKYSLRGKLSFCNEIPETAVTSTMKLAAKGDLPFSIEECFAWLSNHETQEVVRLYAAGKSIREVQDILGLRTSTAYTRLNEGLKRIYNELVSRGFIGRNKVPAWEKKQ